MNWMKYLAAVVFVLILAGCGNGNEANNKENESSVQQDVSNNDGTQATENDGSVEFRNVDVTIVDKKRVTVVGEAKTTTEGIYYKLEQDAVLIEETEAELDEKADEDWHEFRIELELSDETVASEEIPVLMLYGKNESGDEINPNYIPIDFIRQSY